LTIKVHKLNIFKALLPMVEGSYSSSFWEPLLAIGSALRGSSDFMESIASREEGEDLSAITDSECEVVEELLGVAFVLCQVNITECVSWVQRLLRLVRKEQKHLKTVTGGRVSLMRHGKPAGQKYAPVEIIDALANYYKHHSQWESGWPITNWNKATIPVLRHIGASHGYSANLRNGSEHLGNSDYTDVRIFADHVKQWRRSLHDTIEAELRSIKLI
jgi:hypothetical protein